jgi:hypothetical protein
MTEANRRPALLLDRLTPVYDLCEALPAEKRLKRSDRPPASPLVIILT